MHAYCLKWSTYHINWFTSYPIGIFSIKRWGQPIYKFSDSHVTFRYPDHPSMYGIFTYRNVGQYPIHGAYRIWYDVYSVRIGVSLAMHPNSLNDPPYVGWIQIVNDLRSESGCHPNAAGCTSARISEKQCTIYIFPWRSFSMASWKIPLSNGVSWLVELISFCTATIYTISILYTTVDGSEIPNKHLECIKPGK